MGGREIMTGILILLAGIAVFPVLFLVCGSLMGGKELDTLLAPVLGSGEGFASWKLLP